MPKVGVSIININSTLPGMYTEKSLRSAFLLRPKALLEEICDAVMTEQEEASRGLLQLIKVGDYVNLIFGLIVSRSSSDQLREVALWTAGLLAGSDLHDLRTPACAYAFAHMNTIHSLLFNEGGYWKKGAGAAAAAGPTAAAYLISNSVRFFFQTHHGDVFDFLKPTPARLYNMPKEAQNDYLWALSWMFESAESIPTHMVSTFLQYVDTTNVAPIINCLAALGERNDAIRQEHFSDLFHLIRRLYDQPSCENDKLFFVLSNLLCEPGASDQFTSQYALQEIVCDAAQSAVFSRTKLEALWVLSNWVVNCTDKRPFTVNGNTVHNIIHNNQNIGCAKQAIEILPRPDDNKTNPLKHLPSALELIGAAELTTPTEQLQNLVTELRHATSVWSWIPVPDDVTFTAGDLRWMEAMGYVLSHGFFGVAEWLRS